MALRVSKCCCCCSLKYGFLTFAIISLLYRVSAALSFAYLGKVDTSFVTGSSTSKTSDLVGSFSTKNSEFKMNLSVGVGGFVGWYIVTSAILVLAIFGILHKRSIYLYPYIVVLTMEIIVMILVSIFIAIVSTPLVLVNLLIWASINTYAIICLVSLYYNIKDQERSRPVLPFESVPLKTV